MSQDVIIQIRLTLPDGATYRVLTAPEAEPDFEREPLPNPPEAPVNGAPVNRGMAHQQAPSPIWQAGQVHATNHKPLKLGNKGGLYCPTLLGKNPDGTDSWCQFHA